MLSSPETLKANFDFEALQARGAAFLGTEIAIMGGAMSWVSERHLVSAISNAGGFGVIACGAMPPALLEQEIAATQALTDKPFGVNLITMHPQLDELVQVCARAKVGHVVLAGGIPPGPAVRAVKDGGAKLIAFAPALVLAKRFVKSGVDALVIEGSEAGGHMAESLTVLAQEILPHIRDIPVFVAGGLGRGRRYGISGNGCGGGAARHKVCGFGGEHRTRKLQKGLSEGQCPRCAALDPAR